MVERERVDRGLYWDRAWSLVEGCTPVSKSCIRCWSAKQTHMRARQSGEAMRARYEGLTEDRRFNGTVRFMYGDLKKPVERRDPTVFAVWNDFFHEGVSTSQRDLAFNVMRTESRHAYLLLTKRIEGAVAYLQDRLGTAATEDAAGPYRHVWFGTTAENAERLDERLPFLLHIKQRYGLGTYLSLEPLLGEVDLEEEAERLDVSLDELNQLVDCLIIGGESGHGARPIPGEAAFEKLVRQRRGRAVFVKQMGTAWARAHRVVDDIKASRTRNLPESLRVRRLPWS